MTPQRPHPAIARPALAVTALLCLLLFGGSAARAATAGGGHPSGFEPVEPSRLLTYAAPSDAASDAALRKALKRLMRGTASTAGAYAWNITTGRKLFSYRSATPRILASNAKLFTTAAAIDRYGVKGRFSTTLWGDGTLGADGVYDGDLYLRGSGDPLFGSEAVVKRYYGGGASVETLARVLEERGVKSITGRVFGDATLWDAKRGTAAYGYSQSSEIGGALSALAFNRGPWSASENPARYAAAKLRNALRAEDIEVEGKAAVRPVPEGATQLAEASSPTVARLVSFTNKPSDNFLAEMLMKGLAAGETPATTSAGTGVAERFAATFGSRASLADGSGLSRYNRASPHEVVDLLRGMQRRDDFTTYHESLAVPGVDGTLSGRMGWSRDARRCAGKTGTLRDVSALSGYCKNRAGQVIAFSLLMNNVSPPSARTIQDKIVVRLAKSK